MYTFPGSLPLFGSYIIKAGHSIPTKLHVSPAKTQVSLRIRTVGSVFARHSVGSSVLKRTTTTLIRMRGCICNLIENVASWLIYDNRVPIKTASGKGRGMLHFSVYHYEQTQSNRTCFFYFIFFLFYLFIYFFFFFCSFKRSQLRNI